MPLRDRRRAVEHSRLYRAQQARASGVTGLFERSKHQLLMPHRVRRMPFERPDFGFVEAAVGRSRVIAPIERRKREPRYLCSFSSGAIITVLASLERREPHHSFLPERIENSEVTVKCHCHLKKSEIQRLCLSERGVYRTSALWFIFHRGCLRLCGYERVERRFSASVTETSGRLAYPPQSHLIEQVHAEQIIDLLSLQPRRRLFEFRCICH